MEILMDSAYQVLSHLYTAFTFRSGPNFLLKSTFRSGFSISLHLVLLLGLLVFSVWRRLSSSSRHRDHDPKSNNNRAQPLYYYRATVLCCLCVSMSSLAMCLSSYFFWLRNGLSSSEKLDFTVKTISWAAISVYLNTRFPRPPSHPIFPNLLRIWFGFFLCISCYSLALDVVIHERHDFSRVWRIVNGSIDVIIGLFICYTGFFRRFDGRDHSHLEEPLLSSGLTNPKGSETVTPYVKAGIFSIISFSWMNPLIALGNKKTIDLEDVPQLNPTDSLVNGFPNFKSKLRSDGSGVTVLGLAKALLLYSWKEIVWSNLYALVYTLATYVGPYMIDTLVQYLTGRQSFKNEGYVLVSIFVVAKLVECLSQRQWNFRLQQVCIRTRAALEGLIYEKGLTLSCQARQVHSSGEMINFMSVDANRVGDFSWFMHDPWLVFVQVGLALAILYKNLGLAAIATFVATVVVMLGNVPLGRLEEKFQGNLMKYKDDRMKSTSEILKNMRILKLQGWEMKFLLKVQEIRASEAGWLKKFLYTRAISTFVFWVSPTLVSAVTFTACLVMGIPLESGKILSSLATFRILQDPIYFLPDTISQLVQTKVSLNRIASFLGLEDIQSDIIERVPIEESDTAVEITQGNFSWDISTPSPTLKDINLKVLHGMKVAICGTVGSGKSSLLSCIIGEMPKKSGRIKVCGSKALVTQSPWIQSGKIEENILFGKEMNRDRYEMVLDACSLRKDLEVLPFGDQTVIGERGINLSGGQKQRVQIARAIYEDADIYLFDDPFSAVDAHTGSHLFKECLLRILGSKTVIYVTHQIEFLPSADLILVMKDGRITEAGKYNEILQAGTDFIELVGAHKAALSEIDSVQKSSSHSEEESSGGVIEMNDNSNVEESNLANSSSSSVNKDDGTQKQLVQEEEREKGSVGFQVYWKYLTTAYRGVLIPLILLCLVMFQILQIGSNYWMAWATPVSTQTADPKVASKIIILVYVVLALLNSLFIFARSMFVATAGYKTAEILFDKMHHCIFRAPMSFFDSTPSGRILGRASTDQSAVDMTIQYRVSAVANSTAHLLGVIAVMSQVSWQNFFIFIPVITISVWYQRYYISTARELSRLEGVCKAPVIQHFAETISGLTTIRSFDQESRFQDTIMKLSDGYSRPKFHVVAAMEWLTFRLNMLSSMVFILSLIFLLSIPDGLIDPATAGLAVTYGLNLNTLQVWVIWNMCDMENRIISVERILQYTSIPSEPPLMIEQNRPQRSWPSLGEIDIQNLQVRYAPHMPLVLRGITCTFSGGTRTGIVGRTGGGKSTLIQTLFRIVEPVAGRIVIDGIDICSIGVHDLRLRLSIIPQDPTMFEGTVRSNLDPLEEYTDDQIWEALDKCQLADEVRNKEMKLDSKVIENGENWSVGQRQLVCLGRVLLKKSKILVLDEATASVDTATDNLIQLTLRQHFTDCTVVTIAHRITSILDSDMVLLLDHGLVSEYDTPKRLLADKSSSFAQLVTEYTMRSTS